MHYPTDADIVTPLLSTKTSNLVLVCDTNYIANTPLDLAVKAIEPHWVCAIHSQVHSAVICREKETLEPSLSKTQLVMDQSQIDYITNFTGQSCCHTHNQLFVCIFIKSPLCVNIDLCNPTCINNLFAPLIDLI